MRRDRHVESATEVPWPTSEQLRRRQRRYLLMMGVCLTLIVLAWTWVRLWSTPLAVAMSAVASVIPPVAAFIANNGVRGWTRSVGCGARASGCHCREHD